MRIQRKTIDKIRDLLRLAQSLPFPYNRAATDQEVRGLRDAAIAVEVWLNSDLTPESVEAEASPGEVEPRDASDNECPHGLQWVDCAACMEDSDHAYDSAREDRYFHR